MKHFVISNSPPPPTFLYQSASWLFLRMHFPCWTSHYSECSLQSVEIQTQDARTHSPWHCNMPNRTICWCWARVWFWGITLNPPPTSPITFSMGTLVFSKVTSHAIKRGDKKKVCTSDDEKTFTTNVSASSCISWRTSLHCNSTNC